MATIKTSELRLADMTARMGYLNDIIAAEKNVMHRLMYIQERINLRNKMHGARVQDIHHRRRVRT